jgi:chorismate mutase
MVRGIRGAITISEDTPEEVIQATQEMLTALMQKNDFALEDIVSAIFTVTPDIVSAFPALSARMMGWTQVPLMCSQEIPVPGALPRCMFNRSSFACRERIFPNEPWRFTDFQLLK